MKDNLTEKNVLKKKNRIKKGLSQGCSNSLASENLFV